MDFVLDTEQRAYADSVRRLLADGEPVKAARAWAAGETGPGRELWRALAGTGLPALAVAEELGGVGLRPAELAAAFVELGRAGAPGPLVETVAVASVLGSEVASGAGEGVLLPGVLAGEALVTVTDGPYAVDGHTADAVFALDGDTLRHAGVTGPVRASLDPVRRLACCVAGEVVVGSEASGLRPLAMLCAAAQALGVGRALLDASVGYVGRRTQFGRPVGSFQAVKHRLASVAMELEFAEPLLYGAAVAVGGRELPAAKLACGRAAYGAARAALQVHGAVGYADECDVGLWIRKARALRVAWGGAAECGAAVLGG
ncbi:acyl-CoA dehydrogenase family protein [Streptomyces gobiensis]|uniref:acyl-CoA dehydrogenase family protein n=1 Tax=Streptomyces gobiensis TaxID=2875706 RepID=UPI001E4D94A5|nr:acyl-CoA dehydrogenase family protein [Streptomyces gobiensis]UGY93599.1 acyl-CoA/acyl-ACP dehydrogenase [Streptomyces gobiensis]